MNFLKWFIENGSINQSMPELSSEELPTGKTTTVDPYSSKEHYPPTKKPTGNILVIKPNKTRSYWVVEKNDFIEKKLETLKIKNIKDLEKYISKHQDYSIEYID